MVRRTRRCFSRLLLAAAMVASAVSAIACQATAAPPAVPAAGYGFGQGASPIWMSFDDTDRELDAVARTSATWLRVFVDWSNIEKKRGDFDWGRLDNLVNGARERNLTVLGVVAYTPQWARPSGPGSAMWTVPPASDADFVNFTTRVVQRYGDRIENWEIWNEPNLPFFFGFHPRPAERYAALLKATYPAIKTAQPGARVIAAGLSRESGGLSPPNFLAALYEKGAGPFFDAANAHPYVFPGGLAADTGNGWSNVLQMREVMVANGDHGKKIWMTEIGAPTCDCAEGVSQMEQAHQISDVLAAAAGLYYSGPAFVYSVRDVMTADRGNRERNTGALLTSNWQPKYTASVLSR